MILVQNLFDLTGLTLDWYYHCLLSSYPQALSPKPTADAHVLAQAEAPSSGPKSASSPGSNSGLFLYFGFLAPTQAHGFAHASRLAQAQGYSHHLESRPSATLLTPASQWSMRLAPTSRRSDPSGQLASTFLQSSWRTL